MIQLGTGLAPIPEEILLAHACGVAVKKNYNLCKKLLDK